MKRITQRCITFMLIISMVLCTAFAADLTAEPTRSPMPEEPEYELMPELEKPLSERILGDWYSEFAGIVITLALSEDGMYMLNAPGNESKTGTWELIEGLLVLDGDEKAPLLPVGDGLRWTALSMVFVREQPDTYIPAEPFAEAKTGNFDGYWKSYYTASGDGTVLSSAIKEDTELYIEGTKLAVNGSLFGLAMYDCTVENGVLTFVTDKGIVTLQLLRDNYLKLTLSGDAPATLYLSACPIPGIIPEVVTP